MVPELRRLRLCQDADGTIIEGGGGFRPYKSFDGAQRRGEQPRILLRERTA
jgi:hypothetical protein